jgi:hypothetical protein
VGLKLNGVYQLLANADAKPLGDNRETINRDTVTLIHARKEIYLAVNIEKTKYILVSCHQNAVQNWNIKKGNRSFENVALFKYLGVTVTNRNLIEEEIQR